ncbi:hypothetical protein AB0N09_11985 [Streptomyces erythrochromogenes]|uniref:hypothetical protein n=1 Tax=Streptomyces erythrochromogenes TaxID=285574 RepID=UPI00342085C1
MTDLAADVLGVGGGPAATRAALAAARAVAASRPVTGAGGAGLRPTGRPAAPGGHRAAVELVQREVHPYDRNCLRRGDRPAASLRDLHAARAELRSGLHGAGTDVVKARQAAAMTS